MTVYVPYNASIPYNVTLCNCKAGYYGVVSTAQNTILCTACDPSCDTCLGFSTNCTTCYSPNFLTDQATCLPNCSYDSNHLNYYGEHDIRHLHGMSYELFSLLQLHWLYYLSECECQFDDVQQRGCMRFHLS